MVDIILLTAGQSTRFWPLKDKNLVPFFGKPLLYWHYEQLIRVGVKRVIVVANKESEQAVASVPVPSKLTVEYARQEGKGQGQAILAASSYIRQGAACVINGCDVYDDMLIKEILDLSKKHPESFVTGVVQVDAYFPGGYVKLTREGTVAEIIEKPIRGKEPSDMVKLVADVIPDMQTFTGLLKSYRSRPADGYERALNKQIQKGIKMHIVKTTKWNYLKYPWHVLSLMDTCLATISGQMIDASVRVGKYVTIDGPVIIEQGVKINEGTKIVGPVFIGKDTIIGNNNIIRHSHIGASCVTGFSTDITRSYVGNGCWFHSNYLGDSVVGDNVSMGSGTVLANLRLDESIIASFVKGELIATGRNKLGAMIGVGVRIGVNASIMPGIKIGKGSFVGAGVVLGEDLGEEKYCRITPTVVISENKKQASGSRDAFRKKL